MLAVDISGKNDLKYLKHFFLHNSPQSLIGGGYYCTSRIAATSAWDSSGEGGGGEEQGETEEVASLRAQVQQLGQQVSTLSEALAQKDKKDAHAQVGELQDALARKEIQCALLLDFLSSGVESG
eukprot:CAMPEP_0179920302 /NCGR_PEP_ID=MMETSP0983-20121128/4405_1 /TAXON_ID=483367 /ORGANISM="non described non described, Strain CCMP 2436" /LENGTH=123 /DNA_ID=CAMNT_0021823317 /DNA_START=984 /DNA_END=1352 /DNA_ORIENTATION=-